MTPGLKTYIESWLNKAEHDILSAQRLLEIEPTILDNACFHCQQSVEKRGGSNYADTKFSWVKQ